MEFIKSALTIFAQSVPGGLDNEIPGGVGGSAGNVQQVGGEAEASGLTKKGLFGNDSIVTDVINIILYIIGIISVIMLIWGGIQYAISSGDEKKLTTAKHTIIYAIVGLVIAILAWTLVNFVFSAIGGQSNPTSGATPAA